MIGQRLLHYGVYNHKCLKKEKRRPNKCRHCQHIDTSTLHVATGVPSLQNLLISTPADYYEGVHTLYCVHTTDTYVPRAGCLDFLGRDQTSVTSSIAKFQCLSNATT